MELWPGPQKLNLKSGFHSIYEENHWPDGLGNRQVQWYLYSKNYSFRLWQL